ncbi:MAG: PASTA domain-containing protein, partial [Alistipes sp.]|nr:PASTA domain-containing protein [Alistipes sp.]
LEEAYREELSGTDGRALRQRIARRFSGRVPGPAYKEPVDGYDVVTTLDPDLQDVADKALRNQLTAQNALWGTTLVMEVRTGEILAMANLGRNADGSYSERENYALGRCMEPGSTFKLASMLALLDDAHLSPDTRYDTHDGDPVQVGPAEGIRDDHRGDRIIDFRRAVAMSSNVYFAKAIWETYGITGRKVQFSDFLRDRLHLGETVGLERLGERPPVVATDWKVPDPGVMLVKMSYGYRVRMTPIQMLTFYNAIANDGRMVAPLLVRSLQRNGKEHERFEARTIASSVCSEKTLREVRRCLEAVCTEGTASAFFSDTTRLRVAAKTGTAQITDPRYRDHYLGSMVAFFPAENPRYTVLTAIETQVQAGKTYYGGPLAGPVVSRMVDFIYNRSEIRSGRPTDVPKRHPERIKGGDIARIREIADELSPDTQSESRKGWGQATVDKQSRVVVRTLPASAAQMPDLRGMGLKDALFLAESRGLRVRFTGSGAVVGQSIAAGTTIRPGMTVTLELNTY